tara:strand:- start:1022 stop:1330 length:309 start_codon:yes stop_codon:yes gene_type:complete
MVTDTEITEKLKEHREAKKATDTMVDSEDLKLLQKLQSDMDNLVVAFGQLAIQKKAITAQETQLENALVEIKEQEVKLAQQLSNKYGVGSLDISTGKFSASK